jgi:hypothetical protein
VGSNQRICREIERDSVGFAVSEKEKVCYSFLYLEENLPS